MPVSRTRKWSWAASAVVPPGNQDDDFARARKLHTIADKV